MDADLARDDEGQGEPLVLLHGVATSRVIWRHVVGPLAGGG
jgi:pimeloyl-ACP methyl ester carboxylesterase